jgi:hypothetical protein
MGVRMSETVFILCALMSFVCSIALMRGYRESRSKLLFWSGLCFGFLALNNIFLCVDLLLFPGMDLDGPIWRNLLSAIAGMLLLYGLIGELA